MAVGDLKGNLTASVASVTNPTDLTGSVFVQPGDLVFLIFGQQTALTATTPVTDNLGNTYSAVNVGTLSTCSGRAFFSRVTVIGTLTVIHVPATASNNDASAVAAVIQGPFLVSPLDANPANTTDATTPFTCPATGALAQADEVVMTGHAVASNQTLVATSPGIIAGTVARANVSTAVQRRVVSSTSSVTPEFTGTSAAGVQITASFKIDTTPARKQHDWPTPRDYVRTYDLRSWTYNATIDLPIPFEYMGYPASEWPPAPAPERAIDLLTWVSNPKTLRAEPVFYSGVPRSEWERAPAPEYNVTLRFWAQNPTTLRPGLVLLPPGKQWTDLPPRPYPPPGRTWVGRTLAGTAAAATPFNQEDWPVFYGPSQPLRSWTWSYNLNLIGQDRFPPGKQRYDRPADPIYPNQLRTWISALTAGALLAPFRQMDWPLPGRPAQPDRTWIGPPQREAAAAPFNQEDWPIYRAPAQPDRTWIYTYNLNLIGKDELPVGEQVFALPPLGYTYPNELRTWIQTLDLPVVVTPADRPFNQFDWPNPRGYAPPVQVWTFSFNLNLIGQDRFPPGQQKYDRPVDPIYPNQLRTWIATPKPIAAGVPFNQEDWPIYRAPAQPDRTWTWNYNLNLIGKDLLPVGGRIFDLPPSGPLRPTFGWTLSLLQSTLTPAVVESVPRTPLFAAPRQEAYLGQTWINLANPLRAVAAPEFPVGKQITDLPPRLRDWVGETWLANLALEEPGALPFNQYDWPNPRGPLQPERTWLGKYNDNLIGKDVLPPGKIHTALPPIGYIYPNDLRTWISRVNLALTTAAAFPFNQFDWPLPTRAQQPDRAFVFAFNRNLINQDRLPIRQMDWPIYRQAAQPDRGFSAFYNPNLVGKDRLPPGGRIFDLPPTGHYYPTSLRFFSQSPAVPPVVVPPSGDVTHGMPFIATPGQLKSW